MKTTKIIRSLALLLFSSYIVSCSDSMPDRLQTQEEEGDITIVLRLPVSGNEIGTRANPVGGEDGNGREKGLENENAVFDANIFFFKENSLNPSGDAAAVTVANVYVKDLSKFEKKDEALPFEKKVTLKIKSADTDLAEKRMLEGDAEVSFITVLNAGRDLSKVVNNLRELREYINIGDTWTSDNSRDASKCRRFVMTTAYDAQADGSVVIGGTTRQVGSNRLVANTASDAMIGDEWNGKKWIGETTVQRMCARIDLMYKTQNIWGNELLYTVPVSGNQVHVTNFLPVNIMSKPSYLISKSTAAIPSAWTETGLGKIVWGGVENTDFTSSIPSNYMIEPRTLSKVSMTSVPDEWYGLTATSSVKANITLADNGKYKDYFSAKLPEKETEFDNCDYMTVISYANENIQAPDCYNSNFITGVAFRAIFQPVVWSYWNDVEKILTKTEKNDVEWRGMSDKTFWRYLPSTGTKDSNKDSEALYFASQTDAAGYAAAHPQDNAVITKFTDGVCYYNLWLRHFNLDNADPQSDYPMEYAIVRNNIYRFSISFSGPGDPSPTMREPDTMMSRIFVRKWNQRNEKEPLTF